MHMQTLRPASPQSPWSWYFGHVYAGTSKGGSYQVHIIFSFPATLSQALRPLSQTVMHSVLLVPLSFLGLYILQSLLEFRRVTRGVGWVPWPLQPNNEIKERSFWQPLGTSRPHDSDVGSGTADQACAATVSLCNSGEFMDDQERQSRYGHATNARDHM
jgi:hypothetical protein